MRTCEGQAGTVTSCHRWGHILYSARLLLVGRRCYATVIQWQTHPRIISCGSLLIDVEPVCKARGLSFCITTRGLIWPWINAALRNLIYDVQDHGQDHLWEIHIPAGDIMHPAVIPLVVKQDDRHEVLPFFRHETFAFLECRRTLHVWVNVYWLNKQGNIKV